MASSVPVELLSVIPLAPLDFGSAAQWAPAWALAAVLLAAALLRRRLPNGVPQSAFAAGLSLAIVAFYMASPSPIAWHLRFCLLFTGLCVVWLLAASWIEPRVGPENPHVAWITMRRAIGAHAGLLFGAATVALVLATPLQSERPGAAVAGAACLFALTLAAALNFLRTPSRARITWVAGLALLLGHLRPGLPTQITTPIIATWALLAAVFALAIVLGESLLHWWRRCSLWLTDPARLLESDRSSRLLGWLIVITGLAIFLVTVLHSEQGSTPLAAFLAAYALFITEHRRSASPVAGELALLLLGAGVTTAFVAWSPFHALAPAAGATVAAGLLLWFARFWDQQLLEGVAWTTTGRLIPLARDAGLAFAMTAAVFVLIRKLSAFPQPSVIAALVACGAFFGLRTLLIIDARNQATAAAGLLAGAAGAVFGLFLSELFQAFGLLVPLSALVAVSAVLFTIRIGRTRSSSLAESAYDAYVFVVFPVLGVVLVWVERSQAHATLYSLFAVTLWFVAGLLRWNHRNQIFPQPRTECDS